MFAIVTQRTNRKNARKITEYQLGKANIIEIGIKTGLRQLNKVLQKFNGDVILTTDTERLNITHYNTLPFKAKLLYWQFARKILSMNGQNLKIGILDTDFLLADCETTTRLIAHTASMLICTDRFIEPQLEDWLIKTGICPDVTDDARLLNNCDFVFSPFKNCPHSAAVFGVGGVGIDNCEIENLLPEKYRFLLDFGVNAAELFCMLCREGETCFPHLEKLPQLC